MSLNPIPFIFIVVLSLFSMGNATYANWFYATSDTTVKVDANSFGANATGIGVKALNSDYAVGIKTRGKAAGLEAYGTGTSGQGVYAEGEIVGVSALAWDGNGVYAQGTDAGVVGLGTTRGMWAKSPNGIALDALCTSSGTAVLGTSYSGTGVRGVSSTGAGITALGSSYGVDAVGSTVGVRGSVTGGIGISGIATSGTGVSGTATSGNAIYANSSGAKGIYAVGSTYGVDASSSFGTGVSGVSTHGTGVSATSTNGTGLSVGSTNGTGIEASANNSYGTALQAYGATGVNSYTYTTDYYGTTAAFQGSSYGSTGGSTYGVNVQAGYGDYVYGIYSNTWGSGAVEDWSGFFTGSVYVGGYFDNPSDAMFKKNVRPLQGGLAKIMALKPKTYDMKVDEFKGKVSLPKGNQYGLIAQELEAVLPDLVHSVTAPAELSREERKNGVKRDPTKFKSVNYQALIPILIQAIQEQQARIEALERGQK